ncbi:hypothetical protein COUCH_14280 [Couchioplanes caeruleus]|uniref:hypothetical protein n=1 Tax=Couchioplanes caeruleus TaxID=56438 RepID=UPI0020BFD8C3|nr:hypothetical protein [Couchioplanes caeruleus]UQU67356.1 hypothetical protein COUCH_14280 [Couchioplanes caeruleus]
MRRASIARGLLLLAACIAMLLGGAVRADAAPTPSPAPTSPVVDAACAAKAPGSVAWCMPWAVHVDKPTDQGRSHWVTQCSKATSDADKASCAAASITLSNSPRDGTASVLMDGPSTGAGPKGLINCAAQLPVGYNPNSHTQPDFDLKYNLCQQQVSTLAAQMYDPDPKQPDCPVTDVSCNVQRNAEQALESGIRTGIQGLVDAAVQGVVFLLSKLASLVFKVTAISSPDAAFYSTYNSLAGVMVGLVFIFFIISTIINGLRTTAGPSPVASLGGLVRAVLGITFAGGLAYTIVAAWDQATNAVIDANARTPYDPSALVTSFSNLTGGAGTMFIALLLAVLATIGLLLLFVIMLFRGLLATGAALFGAVAMSGQAMHETRPWGRRWFWTVNALGSSKFFIAELWIYGSRAAYGSDDLMNALRGVLLIWLMVVAPWILLRLTTLWDGYLSDVNAHGILSSAGGPLQLGADFVDGFRGAADAGGGGGSPGSDAAGVMDENAASVPTSPVEAAGVGDGTSRQVGDAASTGADGGKVGESANGAGGEDQGQAGADETPNGDEADGIESGAQSAQHDVASGQLTAPGDATGSHGSLPVTPGGAQAADPTGGATSDLTGTPAGTGTGGGQGDSGSTGAAADASTSPIPDTAGAPSPAAAGGDPAGASSAGELPAAAPDPGPQHHSSADGEQSGGRPGAAASGGEGAAAAASEVPIVPI